jgi:predicted neuraminidase
MSIGAVLLLPSNRPYLFLSDRAPLQPAAVSAKIVNSELLPVPIGVESAHASTLTVLSDGRLAAAWFGGEREGSPDTHIYMTIKDKYGWAKPWAVVSQASTMDEVDRHTQRIGNPVLNVNSRGNLDLFYVSTDWGGWAVSKINHKMSLDNGKSWTDAKRLSLGAVSNISYLVRNNALRLANGNTLLPVHHECGLKYPGLAAIDDKGRVVYKWNFNQIAGGIQPAVVAAPNGNLFIYCRDSYWSGRRIHFAEINTEGKIIESGLLNIANPSSAVAVIKITNGYAMVCNPVETGRSQLTFYFSNDGRNFTKSLDLEVQSDSEFSYPALAWDGRHLHIAYTWQRKAIKHVEVSL